MIVARNDLAGAEKLCVSWMYVKVAEIFSLVSTYSYQNQMVWHCKTGDSFSGSHKLAYLFLCDLDGKACVNAQMID